MSEALLQVDGLVKRFGGVLATDEVSMSVTEGELHAVIGPNGAGKTTLLAQLTGGVVPDAGRISLRGRNITRLPPHKRSALGIARSFQITNVFHEMTALENVSLGVQSRLGHSYRFWHPASTDERLTAPALDYLAQVRLQDVAHQLAGALSHGRRRQLEIAMALATQPRLMLLDEPMAGMGAEESAEMVDTLHALKGDKTILLVEHDLDAVFALADRISVLVSGRLIATGAPDTIRNDPDVRAAYLGEGEGE